MANLILISDQVWNKIKSNPDISFFENIIFNLIKVNCTNVDQSSTMGDQLNVKLQWKQIVFPNTLSTTEKEMITSFIDQAGCSVYTTIHTYCNKLRIYYEESYIEYLKK